MALIKCIDCGKEVSDRAKVCPNCGCPIECSVVNTAKENVLMDNIENHDSEDSTISDETALSYEESSQSNNNESKNKKKWFVIGGIVAIIVIVIIIAVSISNKNSNNTYNDSSYNDSSYDDSSYDDYTPSIQYISDRTVDYDETNEYHRVFFGLQDTNNNYISAKSGTATIKIENTAGESIYSKSVSFTESDFTTWTNKFWDSDRLLACIYIKDSELTKGSSDEGKLSISVVADAASFDATTIAIYDLPTKNISIKLPSTPQSFSDYGYSDNLEATIRVDKITYESRVYDYNDVTVTFSFQTTMTYNSTPGTSKYVHIGYKLKNSSGIIVDSGTIGISQSDTGDVSLTEKIFFDLNMKETYTLELSNSTN